MLINHHWLVLRTISRGLAESIELFLKHKVELSDAFISALSQFYALNGEHPVVVIRINTWKIYQLLGKIRFNLKDLTNAEDFEVELTKIAREKFGRRFTMAKISTFTSSATIKHVLKHFPTLIQEHGYIFIIFGNIYGNA